MAKHLTSFTEAELSQAYAAILEEIVFSRTRPANLEPRAILLGGQSGAGKTALHDLFRQKLSNVVVVNGDDYRSFHPRFKQINEQFGEDAPKHTAAWSARITESLIDNLSLLGYDLIIEGTLRTSETPIKTASLLRSRGYQVSLALMAVKPEISLLSCQLRYALMQEAGTTPRATDPEHHNLIVRAIVDNLAELEQSHLFEKIELYSRKKELLYPTGEAEASASEVLQRVLFGPWSQEETEHLAFLEKRLSAFCSQKFNLTC